jgi:serine-type D-Ala-D-Ala carboxypeptidase/endopeptidase
MTSAVEATETLIRRVRGRHFGLATAALEGDATQFALDPGADPISGSSLFQIGSITKTMTGVLVADSVQRGEASLDTRVKEILDAPGRCGDLTLRDLATQHHGLPRLPPNLDVGAVDEDDPYAQYTEAHLMEALEQVETPQPGTFGYSNFAFMLLGLLLGRISGSPYPELIRSRLFEPLGMDDAICGLPPGTVDAAPGYSAGRKVPWWSTQLPGPGGVGSHIEDLARYLRAHMDPDSTPLAQAVDLAASVHAGETHKMGLGWHAQGGGWWHNGGTGGFRSFCAFHAPTRTAVALLANEADASLDSTGFAVLTDMVRAKS